MIAVYKGVKYVRGVAGVFALMVGVATAGVAQAAGPGQFQVGDRIALTIESPSAMAMSDTLTVREGLIVTVRTIGDIQLAGVARSNVQPYFKQQLSKYLRDPVLKAEALVPLTVLGPVIRPGYYVVRSDMRLSDVIQVAGGLNGDADPNKTVIRRGGKEVVGKQAVSQALASGRTVDDLRLAGGDQVVVGEQARRGFTNVLQFTSILLSLTVAVVTLASRL